MNVFVFVFVFAVVFDISRWIQALSSFRWCMICGWRCWNRLNVAVYRQSANSGMEMELMMMMEKMMKTLQELRMLSSVTINWQVRMNVWIQVLNCQNCNQCLKYQVSRTVFPIVKNCLNCPKLSKIVKNCPKLSLEIVIKNCHQKLSSKIVITKYHHKLSGHVSSSHWSNVSMVASL